MGDHCLTGNRFSVLEPCTDSTAQNMMSIPGVQCTDQEEEKEAPVVDQLKEEEHPPFILVRSCNSSKRSSTNLKLRLESIDSHQPMDATALLDTGATGLFIDEPYVEAKRFTRQKLPRSIPVYNIDGTLNEHGSVKECVDLIVRYGDHTERARFYVTQLGGDALVVGHPWLVQHNPEINWATGEVKMTRCPSECRIRHIQAQRKRRQRHQRKRKDRVAEPIHESNNISEGPEEGEVEADKKLSDDPDVFAIGDRLYACTLQSDPAFICASSTVSQRLAEASEKHRMQKSWKEAVPSAYHNFEKVFLKESFDELPQQAHPSV